MLLGWSWLLRIWFSWFGSQLWWESLSSEATTEADLPSLIWHAIYSRMISVAQAKDKLSESRESQIKIIYVFLLEAEYLDSNVVYDAFCMSGEQKR